jgi:hypothetical protein
MGIRYVIPVRGEMYPQMVCDVCGQIITNLDEGNVIWAAPPKDWNGGEWATDDVYFTHKRCDNLLRRHFQEAGNLRTFWEELRLFPVQLMYNLGMRPAARAAYDTRLRISIRESIPRTGLALRFYVFKRDNYRCQICGRAATDGITLEIDHKVPRAKGGTDELSNLWTLCFDCNRGKSDSDL